MCNYKKSVFIIAGVGFAILFIYLTTFFGKVAEAKIPSPRLGDWIANWIATYQTLLSAIIATVGVLLTIFAMNKNNKELLYVEWRNLVFKAMNSKAHLNVVQQAHTRLALEAINDIESIETLQVHCDLVYSNLIRTKHVLKLIQNSDLDLYTQGHIGTDILSLDYALSLFVPKLQEFRAIQSFDDFSINDYNDLLMSMNGIYVQINERSANIIGHFIEGSRKFNPLSLRVEGF